MLGLLRGIASLLFCVLTTILMASLIQFFMLFKYVLPKQSWRDHVRRLLNHFAMMWVDLNTWMINHIVGCKFDIIGETDFDKNGWYFIISNHISWVDILAITKSFRRRLPPPRFLMKSELIWLPFVGGACWGLDYPFLKRYTKKQVRDNPGFQGRDSSTLNRLCIKFKRMPLTIINYIEGTRYTAAKAKKQDSPYKHLLRPRAGGMTMIMQNLGEQITYILNVTLCYPTEDISFWQFMCGKVKRIKVIIEKIPVTPDLVGNHHDEAYRAHVQEWLNDLWQKKDDILSQQ